MFENLKLLVCINVLRELMHGYYLNQASLLSLLVESESACMCALYSQEAESVTM